MKINGEMLTLARDYRDMRQQTLAESVGVSQSLIAKIESGLRSDLDDDTVKCVAETLRFPVEFFQQHDHLLGFGSSAYFYRKRDAISASDRRKIHSIVNLHRIAIGKYANLVDIEPSKPLPQMDVEEYGRSAANVAQALRATWKLPDGPIRDLTALVESAGVLVVPCDFESNAFDATSLRLADMPPLVFMNTNVPGDRWRFTLCHELGHLIMHTIPHEEMEQEANQFAAEFLTPASEIEPQLLQIRSWKLPDVVQLKIFWRVSIAMLLKRAGDLGVFSKEETKRLHIKHASIRMDEPHPLEKEKISSYRRIIAAIRDDLGFQESGISELNRWPQDVTQKLLFSSAEAPQRLRLVQ